MPFPKIADIATLFDQVARRPCAEAWSVALPSLTQRFDGVRVEGTCP